SWSIIAVRIVQVLSLSGHSALYPTSPVKFHCGGLLTLQLMSCGCPLSSGLDVSLYSDMMIALLCPGVSTSGMIVTKCAAAEATTSSYCACVQNPPGSTVLPSGPTE